MNIEPCGSSSRGNVLAVRLDSAFNLNVPPDRPAPYPSTSVDYWQPGGIYRDVRLRVVPPAFLADVFAKPVNVLDHAARRVVVTPGPRRGAGRQGKLQLLDPNLLARLQSHRENLALVRGGEYDAVGDGRA